MADEVTLNVETGEEVVEKEIVEDQDEGHDDQSDDSSDSSSENNESDSSEQSELNDAEDDNERESIRARRREERKHRKEAQREREDTLRRELASRDAIINELRGKVDVIERRNVSSEVAQVDNALTQAQQAYTFFKDQIRVATEAGNGAAVADATEKMFQMQRKLDDLKNVKNAFTQRQATPPPLDPRLANHASAWMEKNKWYDPTGRDQDSKVAMTLDQQLASEGWDATTPQYWQELENRVKKYLPHRANRAKVTTGNPKSVVTGSGREGSVQSTGSYKLSAERVSALKEAGMWDDPKQRAEAVKRFREYDKQNKV